MSNVVTNLLGVIQASRAQRQRIEYLYRCFPQELAGVLTNMGLERGELSKDEMLQVLELRYRKGIPAYQRFFFNPTYVRLLNICRRRLRVSGTSDLFELEERVWNEIEKRQKAGKHLGLRPGFIGRLFRYDPGALVEMLPLVHPLHQNVRGRVVIGVVGSPSAGKDAALRAIFGIDTGNIMPIAGSTKDIEIYEYQQRQDVLVVNTPGMGDVSQTVTQRAVEVLSNIDVYLYLLNSEGGLQAREYDDLNACIQTGKNVVVVLNKIDLLRENKRDEFIQSVRSQLPPEIVVVPSCLDPIPGLMEPMGIDEIRGWLASVSETFVQGLGLPQSAVELKELFQQPAPTPQSQEFKEVQVTPLPGAEALDIQQMYATKSDLVRQHPILATIAGLWLLGIFATPFVVFGIIIWLIYMAVSGVVDFAFFAHETVKETTESVQESLVIPEVKIMTLTENTQKRSIQVQMDVLGLNLDSTTLDVQWFAGPNVGTAKSVSQQEISLKDLDLPLTLTLARNKVRRNDTVYVKVIPRNRVGQTGTLSQSKPITIQNQPISNLTVNLSSNTVGRPAQIGDTIECTAKVLDLDGDADVMLQYQWLDATGNDLPDYAGAQSIQTCVDPTVLNYTCRVKASDGESNKEATASITLNPLKETGPVILFATKPYAKQLKSGKKGLDQVCQSEARKATPFLKGDYEAWFADIEFSPYNNMVRSAGPYVTAKGQMVARDWCQLTTEGMQQPMTTLTSSQTELFFWTRTKSDGRFDDSCTNQKSCGCEPSDMVWFGDNQLTIATKQQQEGELGTWANSGTVERKRCDNLHILCVQQP